jgi:hypothetical protein
MPNHYVGDLFLAIAISGRSRVRTEAFDLTVAPSLAPHPIQMHRQITLIDAQKRRSKSAHL